MEAEPSLAMAVQVDDVSQMAVCSEPTIFSCLRNAGVAFATAVREKGLTASEKSVIISSSKRVARQLERSFSKLGVTVKQVQHDEHLGHCKTAIPKLTLAAINKRFSRAHKRNERVAYLAKLISKAKSLFRFMALT